MYKYRSSDYLPTISAQHNDLPVEFQSHCTSREDVVEGQVYMFSTALFHPDILRRDIDLAMFEA